MKNQDEKLKKLTHEIQVIISDLSSVTTYNSVVSNFFKINALYEKSVFIKNIHEYRLDISLENASRFNSVLDENEPQTTAQPDFTQKELQNTQKIISVNKGFETEEPKEEKNPSQAIEIFTNEASDEGDLHNFELIAEKNNIELENEGKEKLVKEKQNGNSQDKPIHEIHQEAICKNHTEAADTENEIKEIKKRDSLKVNLAKLKERMAGSTTQNANEEASQSIEKFGLTNDEKIFYIKELFNNDFEEWSTTLQKLLELNKIEGASQYLSDIYYKKKWDKKDVIAQKFWQKIEKSFLS